MWGNKGFINILWFRTGKAIIGEGPGWNHKLLGALGAEEMVVVVVVVDVAVVWFMGVTTCARVDDEGEEARLEAKFWDKGEKEKRG